MRKILIAGSGHWGGASFVGEHQIARILARRGWDVGFVSLPITPFHSRRFAEPEIRDRLRLWSSGRKGQRRDGIWAYSPLSAIMPKPNPVFRSDFVFRNWWRSSMPGFRSVLRNAGYLDVDLLLIREPRYHFLLDLVAANTSIYRFADLDSAHKLSFPAERRAEHVLLRESDIVVGTSPDLVDYARRNGATRVDLLENGVDCSLYAGEPGPCPEDLAAIPKPRAILVGSMAWWVDMELIHRTALAHPDVSFVLVGEGNMLSSLQAESNIHVLGRRPADTIPAYLRHSQIGLLPFRHATDPGFLDAVNPLKLHEYMAAGIPVVSTSWKEIRRLAPPAFIADSNDEFIAALKVAILHPGDSQVRVDFASKRDWNHLVDRLLLLSDNVSQ